MAEKGFTGLSAIEFGYSDSCETWNAGMGALLFKTLHENERACRLPNGISTIGMRECGMTMLVCKADH